MKNNKKYLKPITPGEILLEEFLKPNNISQNQIARDIGVPAGRINQIIKGKRDITADTALRLGEYFGMEPQFWLNLQSNYELKLALQSGWDKIKKQIHVFEAAYQ